MKPLTSTLRWLTPLALLTVSTAAAAADVCPNYDEVTGKLGKRYHEQKLFSGFSDNAGGDGSSAMYEFWGNPQRGSWSLIAHKLMLFQDGGRQTTRACAYVVSSGKGFRQLGADAQRPQPGGEFNPEQTRCMARAQHARLLADRYQERPLVSALATDQSLLEIYAGHDSWTVTRAKMREMKNPLNGAALRDSRTGQEIRRLCSSAMFSGVTWGLETAVKGSGI